MDPLPVVAPVLEPASFAPLPRSPESDGFAQFFAVNSGGASAPCNALIAENTASTKFFGSGEYPSTAAFC